jgi:hypothetical protein
MIPSMEEINPIISIRNRMLAGILATGASKFLPANIGNTRDTSAERLRNVRPKNKPGENDGKSGQLSARNVRVRNDGAIPTKPATYIAVFLPQ